MRSSLFLVLLHYCSFCFSLQFLQSLLFLLLLPSQFLPLLGSPRVPICFFGDEPADIAALPDAAEPSGAERVVLLDPPDEFLPLLALLSRKPLHVLKRHPEGSLFPVGVMNFQSSFPHPNAVLHLLPEQIDGIEEDDLHILVFNDHVLSFENTPVCDTLVFLIQETHAVRTRVRIVALFHDVWVVCPALPYQVVDLLQFLGRAELGTGNHPYLGPQQLLLFLDYASILAELSCLQGHHIKTVAPIPLPAPPKHFLSFKIADMSLMRFTVPPMFLHLSGVVHAFAKHPLLPILL